MLLNSTVYLSSVLIILIDIDVPLYFLSLQFGKKLTIAIGITSSDIMYTHRSKLRSSELPAEDQQQCEVYSNLLLDCLMAAVALVFQGYNTNDNDTCTIDDQFKLYTVIHASDVNLRSRLNLMGFSGLESTDSYEVDLVFLDKLIDDCVTSDPDTSSSTDFQENPFYIETDDEIMENKRDEKLSLLHLNSLSIDKLSEKNVNLFLLAGQSNMSGRGQVAELFPTICCLREKSKGIRTMNIFITVMKFDMFNSIVIDT
jgi:hypothetical protein